MKEEAVILGNHGSLIGVVTRPPKEMRSTRNLGIVLLNAGIVHRVGPGRIYVKIARELAALGFFVLRFDFSGIGDSGIRYDDLSFDKSAVEETQAAMNFLQSEYGIRRFLLLGGCSGARVSLETASIDARACGAILINFQVPDLERGAEADSGLRKNSHYVLNFAVRNGQSWRRFFAGQADYKKLALTVWFEIRRRLAPKAPASVAGASFQSLLESLLARGLRPVFVCSAGDSRLEDLRQLGGKAFKSMCAQGKLDLTIVPRSDHTFSSLFDQLRLIDIVREKAQIIEGAARRRMAPSVAAVVPARSIEV
jgi:pimeloyl-ACP methyl ester carboxylesterase